MYESYNIMRTKVWLIMYPYVQVVFDKKTNINFHIFKLALHWRPSLLRTFRGTFYASLILYDSERSINNNVYNFLNLDFRST